MRMISSARLPQPIMSALFTAQVADTGPNWGNRSRRRTAGWRRWSGGALGVHVRGAIAVRRSVLCVREENVSPFWSNGFPAHWQSPRSRGSLGPLASRSCFYALAYASVKVSIEAARCVAGLRSVVHGKSMQFQIQYSGLTSGTTRPSSQQQDRSAHGTVCGGERSAWTPASSRMSELLRCF